MTLRIRLAGIVAIVIALPVMVSCAALVWQPAMPPVTPPKAAQFSPEVIARGAEMAAIGDCAVCHTASHAQPYAGGRRIPTPFGLITATNITPDVESGVGNWSEAAFRRAMRDGVDDQGRFLYPAMPYPHFTQATDQDITALYAFLMTRQPVHAEMPPNELPLPLKLRPVMAGWNLLFFKAQPWRDDPKQSAEWNRGAYLATAIGHCAACHTPINALGGEVSSKPYAGGEVEGWDAPALQAASSAAKPWTVEELTDYLRTGLSDQHGAAGGPMVDVTRELATVPEQDVRAIATYFVSQMPKSPTVPPAPKENESVAAGSAVFAGACAGCHAPNAPMVQRGAPSLALSSVVNAPSPRDAIQTILHGLPWREGKTGPYMPPFEAVLNNQQLTDLVRYIRARFSGGPAWADVEAQTQNARQNGGT